MFDHEQLRALAAVLDEGSFDAAAARLHVTPSAVSQRIKALEQAVGRVLVRRGRPCTPTESGEVLARLAGQLDLLHRDALAALAPPEGSGDRRPPRRLSVAVNADSLSTWFPPVLVDLPPDVLIDVHREDQDHSARLLREGTVVAAVTADASPVQGCRVEPLGAMRYLAVAGAQAHERWFPDGLHRDALARVPMVAFDRVDALQDRFLADVVGGGLAPDVHYVPSSSAFVDVVVAGLGWGMVPEQAARPLVETGAVRELDPRHHLDVPLHWQHWSLRTPTLDDLTQRVRAAAHRALRPVAVRSAGRGRARPT